MGQFEICGNASKAAKRAKDEGDLSQVEKFAQAARDLECDDDDERFEERMRDLVHAKPVTQSELQRKQIKRR